MAVYTSTLWLPCWLRWWRICPQCGRPRFEPWVGKIPWRREWQSTPVFLFWKFHEQRNLAGFSLWATLLQRVGHDWATNTHTPVLHSFLLLRSVPLYMYARLCFSIHQLMDVFGLFLAFCQLWIKLLGTFVCNLWTSVITSLGSMSRSGHMVSVCLTL